MFVTFEGPEGAGKSTVLARVAELLRNERCEVLETREPGSGVIGPSIREILLHGGDLNPKTELFLFLADRAEHVATVIRPALEKQKVVLCDRYVDSTVVYQGVARQQPPELLRELNSFATGGLMPDLTLLFDLDPVLGIARLKDPDRIDREPVEFHQAVRNGFIEEAKLDPARWVTIDASQPLDSVIENAFRRIMSRKMD